MMRRTIGLLATLALAMIVTPHAAAAQPAGKVYRLGYLFTGMLPPQEFLQALRDLGYVEGQNLVIEIRGAEGREDRLPALAAELVRLQVDAIVAPGGAAAQAAQHATTTIPIVIAAAVDPVAAGLVGSLAHPGGNITGISTLSRELNGKRLELLKETVPGVSRVAVLTRAASATTGGQLQEMEVEARALGLQLHILEVRGPHDFDHVFAAMIQERAGALLELPDPLFHANRGPIAEFAARNGLPSIFHSRDFVEAGGLMSYAASFADMYRRAAVYLDKILKGTKPADLPVEQPATFELVINLKTAQALGLTIPTTLLFQATEVIR
jgi:putative tryptophan/tyrosine transport system substrate-binding protein